MSKKYVENIFFDVCQDQRMDNWYSQVLNNLFNRNFYGCLVALAKYHLDRKRKDG